MNSKLIAISALSSLLFAVGCQKNDPVNGGVTPIEVKAAIAGVENADDETTFGTGAQFGMWVVPYITSDKDTPTNDVPGTLRPVGNYFDNVCYTMGATEFTPATSVYYPSASVKVDLYAVSPYDAKMSSETEGENSMEDPTKFNWRVKADQRTADSVVASDLMTTIFNKAKSGMSPAPSLQFTHRLSKVNVNVKIPAKFRDKNVLSIDSVVVVNTRLKASIDLTKLASATVLPTVPTTNNSVLGVKALQLSKPAGAGVIAGDYIYEAIVIPQSIAGTTPIVKVDIKCQDIGAVSLLCYTESTGLTFEQTNQTTFTVTVVDQGSISIGVPTIVKWGSTANVVSDAKRPAKLFVETTGTGAAAAIAKIVKAELSIDGSKYPADVKLAIGSTTKLECTFMQPDGFTGDKLRSIKFMDIAGTEVIVAAYDPVFPGTGLAILGDPTLYNYDKVITKATFN